MNDRERLLALREPPTTMTAAEKSLCNQVSLIIDMYDKLRYAGRADEFTVVREAAIAVARERLSDADRDAAKKAIDTHAAAQKVMTAHEHTMPNALWSELVQETYKTRRGK
jgi:hypothetical protein